MKLTAIPPTGIGIQIERVYERILVAVDGTPASFAAALFAASVRAPAGALHLLCVMDRAHPPLSSPAGASLTERCEHVLASARAAIVGRAPVAERVVASGQALPAILEMEEAIDADLVCVGSGRRRLRPGHVSTAVAKGSQASVAILREGTIAVPRLSRLAVGLRRGPTAEAAARQAFRVAAGTGASVTLFHALVDAPETAVHAEHERDAQALLGELGEEARALGLSPTARILHGDPVEALVAAALEMRADAIFVGTGTRRPLRPLGRVVSRLLTHCIVPLVICREPARSA